MTDDKAISQRNHFRANTVLAVLILLATLTILPGPNSPGIMCSSEAHESFDRNQSMLINLKSAPMSAGFYLLHSYGTTKAISHDLDKALNQVVEVDKTYAKSRHKPDARYLENVCLKMTVARQTADQLQEQLRDAYAELKSSIEETVVTDTNFKLK
jgi:NADH:ubiquinone oxidoreductase subunit E